LVICASFRFLLEDADGEYDFCIMWAMVPVCIDASFITRADSIQQQNNSSTEQEV
jgi:hypothetical protein